MPTKTASTKCLRCHGPATIVDKAPPGESGDVIRCNSEDTCIAQSKAADELEQAHKGVVDAAHGFYQTMGGAKVRSTREVKIPGYVVADLLDAVRDWKDAGAALLTAQRKHGAWKDILQPEGK